MRYIVLLSALLLFVSNVFAQDTPIRDAMKSRLEDRVEKRQEKRELRKEAFQNRKDQLASRSAAMRELHKEKQEAFKERIQELKDTKKKAIVERVDQKIDTLNKKHTERLTNALEKMNDIVGRLEDKVASASSLGKNTASASAAIETAKTAISTAQTAVSDQSAKDYTPTITDETTLGQVVSGAFTTFRSDMQSVHKLVSDAKQAVVKAAVAVRQLQVGEHNGTKPVAE